MILGAGDTDLRVRPATSRDRRSLDKLLKYQSKSHRHLDWKSPLDWLGRSPFLVAQLHGRPAALLACPPDPLENAWIRAFAAGGLLDTRRAWEVLWEAALSELESTPGVERSLAIVLEPWFAETLAHAGFRQTTEILMLSWENERRLPPQKPAAAAVRPMEAPDLAAVASLDRASFAPVWHNSLETLTYALGRSVIATVSEDSSGITGYQISSPNPFGGHLARLAVRPDLQGRGIGYALLYDLLQRFQAKGAFRVTVNTQADNRASHRLYFKAGFHLTGERYPIYEYRLGI